ncbi:SLATT domain-containing protein [Actinoplanes sp. Pm04-4]|uniref:SLATT domain-containing protein n=1 Tax=Paractinoplanes pyxinae TaxID=2997416 RepID=A0ABT4BJE6_9ACTN|nr:SLATT domain-containing protein [Actinoplanes pyxinae]MCY1145738.1 SLATT domain-containing protein [Actinoplanes pyxinae]
MDEQTDGLASLTPDAADSFHLCPSRERKLPKHHEAKSTHLAYPYSVDRPEASRELLHEWERRCRVNIDTHAWAERSLDRLNTTCAVVSIGSMVLLGVIASGYDLTDGYAQTFVVTLSVVAALVSVIGTVRNYGLLASSHRNAARQYGALRRDIELLRLSQMKQSDEFDARVRELQRRWDWVADMAPNAPKRIRDKARGKVRSPSAIWSPSALTVKANDAQPQEEKSAAESTQKSA